MKLNLRVFAAQTFTYQLSLFVQITCDVSQYLYISDKLHDATI
jgi:hypothetical protein